MTNDLITKLEKHKVADSENLSLISIYLDQAEVTFFSWKMFKYWFKGEELKFDFSFDTKEAEKYIEKEKYLISVLEESNIKFKYIKLIPDELIKYFFDIDVSVEVEDFKKQVEVYFQNYYKKTEAILFSDYVRQNKGYYDEIFNKVLEMKIDKKKFEEEKKNRFSSEQLAQKAFALFAAETNLITQAIPNAVLLAGERSVDTYKYEFFKDPPSRPILPKMFVI